MTLKTKCDNCKRIIFADKSIHHHIVISEDRSDFCCEKCLLDYFTKIEIKSRGQK